MGEVQRYELIDTVTPGSGDHRKCDDGDWVNFDDHADAIAERDAEIARLREEIAARKKLGKATFDVAVDMERDAARLRGIAAAIRRAKDRGDSLRSQLAEANATIERLTAENIDKAERIAELERGQPGIPDWEPVAKALGCERECGFERRGTGFVCSNGEACGRYVDPSHSAFAELARYHKAMTGEPRDSYALTTDGPSVGPGSSANDHQPPNLAGMTLDEAAEARLAMGPGTFEDIDCFVQARREEIADAWNYNEADRERSGGNHWTDLFGKDLRNAWKSLRKLELRRERDAEQAKPAADGWRPIATAPKTQTILVTDGCDVLISRWTRYENFWRGFRTRKPTHWQPLPKPPAGERES